MKKQWIVLLLLPSLLLSACGMEPADTQPPAQTQQQETQSTEPTAEPEAAPGPVFEQLPSMEDYYQHGNMQINVPAGDFLLYDAQVIFDVRSESALYAYDLKSGEVRRFCIKEHCDHSGSDCVIVKNYSQLDQYGGKLYIKDKDSNIKTLTDGKWEELVKGCRLFWHGDGELFTVNNRGELQVHAGGESRTLLEDYHYHWNAVFDGYLYGANIYEVIRLELGSETPAVEVLLENAHATVEGNHIYYTDEENFFLYRCDMDGTNPQLLLEKPVLPASINFDEEYLYFRLYTDRQLDGTADSQDIYRMSKADPAKPEKIATLPEPAYQIFTVPGLDILFVTARVYFDENGTDRENIYVMRTDGSDLKLLDIPEP